MNNGRNSKYMVVSRLLTSRIEENEELAKGAILTISCLSLALCAYLNVFYLNLSPTIKVGDLVSLFQKFNCCVLEFLE